MFRVAPFLELKKLEAIFRHKIFNMFLSQWGGKLTTKNQHIKISFMLHKYQIFCSENPHGAEPLLSCAPLTKKESSS